MLPQLLLIRHGHTVADATYRIEGSADYPLTELGRRQAERLAARLAAEYTIRHLYTSPLQRAVQTAAAVGAAIGLRPDVDDRLREMDSGLLAGLPRDEADHRFPRPPADRRLWEPTPGGETMSQHYARTAAFWFWLRDQGPRGSVAIVTHGGTMQMFYRAILGLPVDAHVWFACDDTSMHEFRFTGRGAALVRANDAQHLAGLRGGR